MRRAARAPTLRARTVSEEESDQDAEREFACAARRLLGLLARYVAHFATSSGSRFERAAEYVEGLLVTERGNMLRMGEALPEADEQALQHFLSNSEWNEREVVKHVARDLDALLGGQADSCLILDDTGIPKKGEFSVGVARQYCGEVGKVDNCQVAVFAVMSCGTREAPVNYKLYLPGEWIDDPARCRRAKIPLEHRRLRTKHDLALEIVDEARGEGLRYGWIGCDGGYGSNPAFLRALQERNETFVADVHKDQVVYLEDPTRRPGAVRGIRVDAWGKSRPESAWRRVDVRATTKGLLRVEILHHTVWLWDREEEKAHEWRLLIRREVGSPGTVKYVLSNAGPDVSTDRLAFMQAQRYWVERSFQNAKTEAGLGDYQVRGWRPWQRHMALVLMAMVYLLEERIAGAAAQPLISCRDVTDVLKQAFRSGQMTAKAIKKNIKKRHRMRQAAIRSAESRQLAADLLSDPHTVTAGSHAIP